MQNWNNCGCNDSKTEISIYHSVIKVQLTVISAPECLTVNVTSHKCVVSLTCILGMQCVINLHFIYTFKQFPWTDDCSISPVK